MKSSNILPINALKSLRVARRQTVLPGQRVRVAEKFLADLRIHHRTAHKFHKAALLYRFVAFWHLIFSFRV